jgi:hypothetical protein
MGKSDQVTSLYVSTFWPWRIVPFAVISFGLLQNQIALGRFCEKLARAQKSFGHMCPNFIATSAQTVKRSMFLELECNSFVITYFQHFQTADLWIMPNRPQIV